MSNFEQKYLTNTTQETLEVGIKVVDSILEYATSNPVIIYLQGDLGVGKTQFVKGIGQALGIKETVTSPSYVYMRNYSYETGEMEGELVHIDGWRTQDFNELLDTGLEMFLLPGNIIAIEWPRDRTKLSGSIANYKPIEVDVKILELDERRRDIQVSGELPERVG